MHGNCASCDESAGLYGFLGSAGTSKSFDLPAAHSQVRVSMRVWKVDSWDDENIFIAADGVTVWDSGDLGHSCVDGWTEWASSTYYYPADRYGCHYTSSGITSYTCYIDVELVFAHTADTLALAITSDVTYGVGFDCDDESFGVSEVKIEYFGGRVPDADAEPGADCAPDADAEPGADRAPDADRRAQRRPRSQCRCRFRRRRRSRPQGRP